jgi:hypothetical protein
MSEDTKTPNLSYAAALLKKLISPSALHDPCAADFSRLTGPWLEIALAVLSEGPNKAARRKRLEVETKARGGLDPFLLEIESADPGCDLALLQTSSGWNAFDLADVISEKIPSINWLVKPYLARPSVTAWFGKAKAMKSLLVLDMCLNVAGGYPWLVSNPSSKDGIEVSPVKVVWLDLENGALTLKRRMKAFASALGMSEDRGQMIAYSMPNPWPDLSKIENVASMISRLTALGDIGILVVDHLNMLFGPIDENSPLASQIMGAIRQISEACNLAIVLIHHSRKGQGKDGGALEDQLRGSGAIMAGVDAAFLIERDKTDKTQLKIIPVATRGPDAPNVSARFSFEQDENLDLTQARFWRLVWRTDLDKAHDAIIAVLGKNEKNYTNLISAVKQVEPGVSDKKIRDVIAALEGTNEICFTAAAKGAKIYRLAGENETEN